MGNEKFMSNSEDDYEDNMYGPCFKIDTRNVQLKDVPTTGEEYLASVIAERRKIPAVTRCNVDYTKVKDKQTFFVEETTVANAPDTLKPTMEWQNCQVADFSEMRLYISRMRNNPPENGKKIRMLSVKNEENLEWWKNFFNTNEPNLSCVLGFKMAQLDIGLEMLITIIKDIKPGDSVDYKTGKWIYSILACRKEPLVSDTVSIIRDLARCCAEIRSHIKPDAHNAMELVKPLNLIICIVARYFRQLDLADNKN